jgi:hypothetical protein
MVLVAVTESGPLVRYQRKMAANFSGRSLPIEAGNESKKAISASRTDTLGYREGAGCSITGVVEAAVVRSIEQRRRNGFFFCWPWLAHIWHQNFSLVFSACFSFRSCDGAAQPTPPSTQHSAPSCRHFFSCTRTRRHACTNTMLLRMLTLRHIEKINRNQFLLCVIVPLAGPPQRQHAERREKKKVQGVVGGELLGQRRQRASIQGLHSALIWCFVISLRHFFNIS